MNRNAKVIDMHSQWIGESLIRTVTRHVGKKNKIVVDVTEFTPHATSKRRAYIVASEAARRVGCSSIDAVSLSDTETVRESHDLHTNEPTRTNVRTVSFAFDGVE